MWRRAQHDFGCQLLTLLLFMSVHDKVQLNADI